MNSIKQGVVSFIFKSSIIEGLNDYRVLANNGITYVGFNLPIDLKVGDEVSIQTLYIETMHSYIIKSIERNKQLKFA